MAPTGPQERARIARAIWAYSTKTQEALAEEAQLNYNRLRAITARSNPDPATLDELLALARVAGIPEEFAMHGFDAIAVSATRAEIDALDQKVDGIVRQSRRERDELTATVDALAELLEEQGVLSSLAKLHQIRRRLRGEGH